MSSLDTAPEGARVQGRYSLYQGWYVQLCVRISRWNNLECHCGKGVSIDTCHVLHSYFDQYDSLSQSTN